MKQNMIYLLTLKNGETRVVKVLSAPKYKIQYFGDASPYYLTDNEIITDAISDNKRVESVDRRETYNLFLPHMGFILDEASLFMVYKAIRNPIAKLEVFTEEEYEEHCLKLQKQGRIMRSGQKTTPVVYGVSENGKEKKKK